MSKRDEFVAAMRCVAHSVTVVSTNGEAGQHGATVSAFCSVSADPPMALVCLNAESKITELVEKNGSFTITVLPSDEQMVSDRFAGRHDNQLSSRFDGFEIKNGAPVVDGATIFHCDVESAVSAGSHRVVLGRVLSSTSGSIDPLIYLDGAYHQISKFEKAAE